jgi:hypothetical protein
LSSLPPRRSHHRNGDHNIVIERVIERSSSSIVYPMLTCTNYTEWSIVMHVNLQVVGLWNVIESDSNEYRDDRNALAAILRVVPLEMQAGLAVKSSAREA